MSQSEMTKLVLTVTFNQTALMDIVSYQIIN